MPPCLSHLQATCHNAGGDACSVIHVVRHCGGIVNVSIDGAVLARMGGLNSPALQAVVSSLRSGDRVEVSIGCCCGVDSTW